MFKSKSLIEIRTNSNRHNIASKSINENTHLPDINIKNQSNDPAIDLIKHSLNVKEKIKKIEKDKKQVIFKENDYKTIMRPKEQIYTESKF